MKMNFNENAEAYANDIYTFAYYWLGNPQDAEDVAQDVLVRLWRHEATVSPEKVRSWVMKVTRNACTDFARKRSRTRNLLDLFKREGGHGKGNGNTHPQKAVELGEMREQVRLALDAVREPYRSLVIQREIQGLSYKELAESFDMPVNRVKVFLHRGRGMLRGQLEKELAHES